MNLTGILFALLTTLSWSIGIFPFTRAARLIGANELNLFRLILATMIIGLFSWAVAPERLHNLFTPSFFPVWCWLGLSGIIGLTIGDYFAFGMFAILGARLGSVLTTFAPAAAVLLGHWITGEHISIIGLAGIALTILGVIRISLSKDEQELIPDHGHGSKARGIIFGILAAICQGAGLVLAKKGILAAEQLAAPIFPFHATFIRLSVATGSLLLLTTFQGKTKKMLVPVLKSRNGGIKYALAGTLFGPVIGVTCSLYAVTFIDASVAQTIFSMVPVVALFLAYFLLREKITRKAFAGVCIAVLGVVVLIWRDRLESIF